MQFVPDLRVAAASVAIFAAYFVLLVLMLGRGWRLVAAAGIVLLVVLLSTANQKKIALTQLPITTMDLRILAGDPKGLVDAYRVPHWIVASAALALCALAIALVVRTARKAPRGRLLSGVLALSVWAICFWAFSRRYVRSVDAYVRAALPEGLWEPVELSRLSEKIGIVGFLIFSEHLEQSDRGVFFAPRKAMPPPSADVSAAAGAHVHFAPQGSKRPNIMVVLAESTFDVDRAFDLAPGAPSPLFGRNDTTRAVGPLFVNAVGGGTWRTEFETIVGLDERLFGYMGYYTHASLSPFVRASFPRYLKDHGYTTTAYYPVEGSFYNARHAYANYGFDAFVDGPTLKLAGGWGATDVAVADAVIRASSPSEEGPFLKYVVLVENHSPHACRQAANGGVPPRSFSGDSSPEENCVLNEYLRRQASTATAVQSLEAHMANVESKTGRPFVILTFGDHQPHTFTDSTGFGHRHRSARTMQETFFRLASSVDGVVRCCDGTPPPATLIPTLLSSYVAASSLDLYLPVHWLEYDACGSDFLARGGAAREKPSTGAGGYGCRLAEELIEAYRRSGIF